MLLYLLLSVVHIVCGTRHCGLVTLQLDVIIVTPYTLEPLGSLLGSGHIFFHDFLRQLTTQASRADDKSLVVFFQLLLIGTRMIIVSICPRLRHNLDKVLITLQVLCQQDKVPTLVGALRHRGVCYIHLAAQYGLENLFLLGLEFGTTIGNRLFTVINLLLALLERSKAFLQGFDVIFGLTVLLLYIVKELFNTKHITVVGKSHTGLTIFYSLIDKRRDRGLSVEHRELRVNVQVNKRELHISCFNGV